MSLFIIDDTVDDVDDGDDDNHVDDDGDDQPECDGVDNCLEEKNRPQAFGASHHLLKACAHLAKIWVGTDFARLPLPVPKNLLFEGQHFHPLSFQLCLGKGENVEIPFWPDDGIS